MKDNKKKTTIGIIFVGMIAWILFITYEVIDLSNRFNDNIKTSGEVNVNLIHEINELNIKIEKLENK